MIIRCVLSKEEVLAALVQAVLEKRGDLPGRHQVAEADVELLTFHNAMTGELRQARLEITLPEVGG
jgi:hypothetical protein